MQRNANIEQTSEINKDFFVISQRVKQIFAVYCKYAKNSKKSAFLQILLVSLQKSSPQTLPEWTFILRDKFTRTCVLSVYIGFKTLCVGNLMLKYKKSKH